MSTVFLYAVDVSSFCSLAFGSVLLSARMAVFWILSFEDRSVNLG
ncbi:uncharacterized protein PGTG_22263 [Puccinia graminis f. sp. tritici CRL 75-36-700-3]|uniref:Uncharacterized protein n=1 Tax=Puccinia graminis f. sp. tritici (strain CRL 75-36-700-3 / race SCCL) TaxID=418459 RepID=H6QU37_PUCGT|nr:uncharacterized protein PGTG_22263 [Puccinia graminis f. sp. tritici CRL 75-36-700-3]EHS64449.1 hypothetical protein PGTG_22263 [Puccinia graminis f. sp. tritici CRL 75-36-700-3]